MGVHEATRGTLTCYSREHVNDRVGERKLTPLYYAVESGRTENIRILLEHGASVFTASLCRSCFQVIK